MYTGELINSLMELAVAPLRKPAPLEPGQHVHSCFVCGQEFKCKCSHAYDRFICGDCDGEVF